MSLLDNLARNGLEMMDIKWLKMTWIVCGISSLPGGLRDDKCWMIDVLQAMKSGMQE